MNTLSRVLKILAGSFRRRLHLPTNSVACPALALGTWIQELKQFHLPLLRGWLPILAIRNATWVEWAVYTACWMRKLGYAPILVYSGRQMAKIYGVSSPKQWLRHRLMTAGFWKMVSEIPDVVLWDVDRDETPADVIDSYGEFAKNYAHTMAAYNLYAEEYEQGHLKEQYAEEVAKAQKELAQWGGGMRNGVSANGGEIRH